MESCSALTGFTQGQQLFTGCCQQGRDGFLLLGIKTGPALTTEAQRIATGLDSFTLLAIPFFILAGQLMNRGGIARRLIEFAKALLGALPGGLAHVNILAAMLFAAISGSAVATASAGSSTGVPGITARCDLATAVEHEAGRDGSRP